MVTMDGSSETTATATYRKCEGGREGGRVGDRDSRDKRAIPVVRSVPLSVSRGNDDVVLRYAHLPRIPSSSIVVLVLSLGTAVEGTGKEGEEDRRAER